MALHFRSPSLIGPPTRMNKGFSKFASFQTVEIAYGKVAVASPQRRGDKSVLCRLDIFDVVALVFGVI